MHWPGTIESSFVEKVGFSHERVTHFDGIWNHQGTLRTPFSNNRRTDYAGMKLSPFSIFHRFPSPSISLRTPHSALRTPHFARRLTARRKICSIGLRPAHRFSSFLARRHYRNHTHNHLPTRRESVRESGLKDKHIDTTTTTTTTTPTWQSWSKHTWEQEPLWRRYVNKKQKIDRSVWAKHSSLHTRPLLQYCMLVRDTILLTPSFIHVRACYLLCRVKMLDYLR